MDNLNGLLGKGRNESDLLDISRMTSFNFHFEHINS